MSDGIVPLRQKGDELSALARVDVAAVEMLASGQVSSLQIARAEVILANLREQRDHMAALLADLREREPTGKVQIDDTNANLITAINTGIVQIDLFIARGRVFSAQAAQPEAHQPEVSERSPTDA